ncbi:MAG: phage major capsid protein [Candidatus Latescibacteria bacterium]|nr:phage major capsid protein [Candidatus Latescibacterota bacterium]NIO78052.1 phage major capsid protein [Candidatus Latescibacterota bacterium]
MTTLQKLKAQLDAITSEMRSLNDSLVEGEEVRGFTPEEQSQYDELEARADKVQSAIKREEKLAEQSATSERLKSQPVNKAASIQMGRSPNHNEKEEYRGFKTFGEQLKAIADHGRGIRTDRRLGELMNSVQTRDPLGSNTLVGSEGGFLIQSDFATSIQLEAVSQANLASLADVAEVSAGSNEWVENFIDESSRATGSRLGGVQAFWRGEGESVTATQPKFRQLRLPLHNLSALYYATEEQLADASALESTVGPGFQLELAWVLDDAILTGDGSAKPYGILNHASLKTVAKEGSQAADTVVYANVRKMRNAMLASSRPRGIWLVHPSVPAQLEQMELEGTNASTPIFMPAGGISQREFDTLYGRPIIVMEQCKALGDLGDIFYADMSGYRLIRKGGIDSATSMHVRFTTHEQAFRWNVRVGGSPKLRTAITDANGGATRSNFVSLAERA